MKKILPFASSVVKAGRKQFRIGFIAAMFCFFAGLAYPQLKISSTGNVGIDVSNPVSRFSVGGSGVSTSWVYFFNPNTTSTQTGLTVSQTLSTGSWTYGTYSQVLTGSSGAKVVGLYGNGYKSTSYTNGRSFGVYGLAGNATSGYNYGVYGLVLGSNNGAAIFGATPGYDEISVNGIYAGYFRGKVFIEDKVGIGVTNPVYKLEVNGDMNAIGYVRSNGVILTSDSREKTDIQELGNGNLSKLNSLKVQTFKYRQPDFNDEKLGIAAQQDTGKVASILPPAIPNPELYQQTQIGLLAQDLQKVYPNLVIEDKEGILGINYSGLVAVLVAAIKEQQVQIEALKQQISK